MREFGGGGEDHPWCMHVMELQAAVFEHIQEREDLAEPIRRRVGELNVHLGMDVLPQAPEEATVEEAPESAPVRIDSYFRRGVQAWDGGKRKRCYYSGPSFTTKHAS